MTFILIVGGIMLLSIIALIIGLHFDVEACEVISLLMLIISTIVMVITLCTYIPKHIDYCIQCEKNRYIARYNSIIYAVKTNDNGVVLVADDIAKYNASILNGRLAMNDDFRKEFNYDFYYDLPLIEYETKDGDNNVQ